MTNPLSVEEKSGRWVHRYHCQWITALCLVGLVASTHAGTHQIEGRIVGVHDGDSITLLDAENRQHKIRLDGIDAPELGQPFGRVSKQRLTELLANREAVAECGKTDRYRCEVCRVLVGGADAGLEQSQGWPGLVLQALRQGTATRSTASSTPTRKRRHEPSGAACGLTPSQLRPGTGGHKAGSTCWRAVCMLRPGACWCCSSECQPRTHAAYGSR
jgi:hypothetical protein